MRVTDNFTCFTPSQRHALDADRNLFVRANAGSGKTSVLVERIVQILARSWDEGESLSLSTLVAITFTRKAATELQDRLRKSFTAMRDATADVREQDYWGRATQELSQAMIGTIDSFCSRILREFSLEDDATPRLEPDFEPLEDYDRIQLQREAIDNIINRLSVPTAGTVTPEEQACIDACRWWATQEGYSVLTRHLETLLNDVVEPAIIGAAHPLTPTPTERVHAAWSAMPVVARLEQDRAELIPHLQAMIDAIGASPAQRLAELRDRLAATIAELAQPGPEHEGAALRWLTTALLTDKGDPRKAGLKRVAGLLAPLQETWGPLLASFTFDYPAEERAREAADKLVLLLQLVHDEYLRLCHDMNRWDFTTLARRARDLLRRSEPVRERLKQRCRYLMVDEFQDTNPLQWEIISWVAGNGPDSPLDRDRLFVVGDPQQSIFRFRQADVSVFQQVQERIRSSNAAHGHAEVPTAYDRHERRTVSTADQRLGLVSLTANFRSLSPLPLCVLDRVFRYSFDPIAHKLDLENNRFEVQYQPLAAGLPSWPDVNGEVRYIIPEEEEEAGADEEGGAESLGPAQVRATVEQLRTLHGQPRYLPRANAPEPLRWQDMAILLPSRTLVLTALEKELRRRDVPFVVTGGIGFWQRLEIRDMISLASCLADHGDELALFALLRSPLGQCTDTQILFLSQLGLGSLVRGLRIVANSGDTLVAANVSEEVRGWSAEHWQRLPPAVQEALTALWAGWSAPTKDGLRQLAARLRAWRQRVDRLGHADLLQKALEESGAYTLYAAEEEGEQILANLERLFDLIRVEEGRRSLGLGGLARRLRAQVDESLKEEQANLALDRDAVQVMTVHAAKGLQFPVVAVLRMERQAYQHSRQPLRVKNPADTLLRKDRADLGHPPVGTVALTVRHPARPREMYIPRLLHGLRELDKAQQIAESRRLFYVAATRAEERLLLTGKPPRRTKTGWAKTPISWQRWFEEALDLTEAHRAAGVWEEAAGGLRVIILSEAPGQAAAGQTKRFVPAEALDLRRIEERPLLPTLTVTMLGEMRRTWQRDRQEWWLRYRAQLQPRPSLPPTDFIANGQSPNSEVIGKAVGTLVHRLFEMGEGLVIRPAARLRPLLEAMAVNLLAREGDEDLSAPSTVAAVVRATEANLRRLRQGGSTGREFRRLLETAGAVEVDFALRLGRWQITGRFDKLLPCADQASRFAIVDWKTDREGDPAAVMERHRSQLQLYALALHRAGKAALINGAVPVYLALLHNLRVMRLEFSLAELESCAEKLMDELAQMENSAPEKTAGLSTLAHDGLEGSDQ
jgi:ATP-dependent helicase/nuclease subunit A